MSVATDMEVLLEDITTFLRKILILKIYNIAIELVTVHTDQHGIQHEKVVLATELTLSSPESSNLEQLSSGLEDCVCNHRNCLSGKCQSCFSTRDNLKVGNGQACKQKHGNDALAMEVVIIISHKNELLGPSTLSCFMAFEPKTEIHSYAPDLARSIAGLILSSDDPNFQGECISLLGMETEDIEGEAIEKCIEDKIISAIDTHERRPPSLRSKAPAPFLFRDEHLQEPEYMSDKYDEGEEDD